MGDYLMIQKSRHQPLILPLNAVRQWRGKVSSEGVLQVDAMSAQQPNLRSGSVRSNLKAACLQPPNNTLLLQGRLIIGESTSTVNALCSILHQLFMKKQSEKSLD